MDTLNYHRDHLGSTRTVVDQCGTVLETYDYMPFGEFMDGRILINGTGARSTFTGHVFDSESVLYTMHWRRYNARIGQFRSPDPMADSYPGWNAYHYAANNPLIIIDPDGTDWYDINGTITWFDHTGSMEMEIDGQSFTFESLGKNVLVSYHMRDAEGNEEINSAFHVLNLETNTEGATAVIEGNTVPAETTTMNTLAEGLYPARFQARASKPGELALIINEGRRLPTTKGGTMTEIFFHRGNVGRPSLTTNELDNEGRPQYISRGCITGPSCFGSAARFNAFMNHAKNFNGNYYLRSNRVKK